MYFRVRASLQPGRRSALVRFAVVLSATPSLAKSPNGGAQEISADIIFGSPAFVVWKAMLWQLWVPGARGKCKADCVTTGRTS